jgi:hypothetical protein
MLGEPITCLGLFLLFIFAFPRACCLCFFIFFLFFYFFVCAFFIFLFFCVIFFFLFFCVVKKFKKTKICLVSCFSFFFCLMHLDSSLNSHVAFMDLIPCVLECS